MAITYLTRIAKYDFKKKLNLLERHRKTVLPVVTSIKRIGYEYYYVLFKPKLCEIFMIKDNDEWELKWLIEINYIKPDSSPDIIELPDNFIDLDTLETMYNLLPKEEVAT